MFNNKKNTNRYHNYIIVSEKDSGVSNIQFSKRKAMGFACLSALLVSVTLFFSANVLTDFLYKNKVRNLKASYDHLSETLVGLQSQLENISGEVRVIEKKDQAIRTYAGLPQIDKEVRQLVVPTLISLTL